MVCRRVGISSERSCSNGRLHRQRRQSVRVNGRTNICFCPNVALERFGDKPEAEKRLPGFVRHFQEPFRLRAHDIAGQIGADRDRLFPGSLGTFKCRLNAASVGKFTPAYLKAISRHAWDFIVSPAARLPCCVLSEQYCSRKWPGADRSSGRQTPRVQTVYSSSRI